MDALEGRNKTNTGSVSGAQGALERLSREVGQLEDRLRGLDNLERRVDDIYGLEDRVRDLDHRIDKLERGR